MNRARYRKHRSTASILLIITAIAAAVLIAAAVFVYFAGIRYMRYNYEAGYIKYFGRVDDNGDPLSGTLVYESGVRAKVNLEKSEIVYSNGDLYDGPLKDLRRHGEGKLIYAGGDVYEGSFAEDKIDGYGRYTYANGDVYEGEFKNGLMDGEGT